MNKKEIDELERVAEQNSEWLEKARETIAAEKGKKDDETEEIDEDVFKQYMECHSEKDAYEYLVRGAKLRCRCGSHIRMLNLPECHGVYIGENPMVHEYDCIQGTNKQGNISWFGICQSERSQDLPGEDVCYEFTEENRAYETSEETVTGKKCQPIIVGVWQDVYDKSKIVDQWEGEVEGEELCSLTTGSFLVCNYGGIIEPITSGQEYEITTKDLGLDENGKSDSGNIVNENVWKEIENRKIEGIVECGEAECLLAHERHIMENQTDAGNIHGTNYFTVIFQYEDGRIIDEQEVKKGESAKAPTELEEKEGWSFTGWDNEFVYISEDMVITAMYEIVDITNPEVAKRYIWDFFIDAGYSEYMAAGILGNVHVETIGTFSCTIGSGHYGLFQFEGRRKKDLDEWVSKNGKPEWTDLQAQCEFALYECENPGGNGWLTRNFHVTINEIEINKETIAAREIIMEGTKENFENSDSATMAAMIFAASYERCPMYDKITKSYKKEIIDGKKFYTEYQDQQNRCYWAEFYFRMFSGE